MRKEQNFISAVVYVQRDDEKTLAFFQGLNACMDMHFEQYELIAVNVDIRRQKDSLLRQWGKTLQKPLTIINMSLRQPHEQCMNAGMDIAIGDYVYEFDSAEVQYSEEIVWNAYQIALKGNDIVAACPKRERFWSKAFYRVFNAHSHAAYKLHTDAFRLVSRRAVNRVHAINENLPYRKAAYAACGLKMEVLEFVGSLPQHREGRFELAIDSLALYTDFAYKFSLGLTLLMLLGTMGLVMYTAVVYVVGNPVSGWTTTMLVLTGGLTGIFAVLAVVLKYQTLLLKLIFQKQYYQIEEIERI